MTTVHSCSLIHNVRGLKVTVPLQWPVILCFRSNVDGGNLFVSIFNSTQIVIILKFLL